jgi:hypothetical protein
MPALKSGQLAKAQARIIRTRNDGLVRSRHTPNGARAAPPSPALVARIARRQTGNTKKCTVRTIVYHPARAKRPVLANIVRISCFVCARRLQFAQLFQRACRDDYITGDVVAETNFRTVRISFG